MCKVVKRGYFPSDKKEFTDNGLDKLYHAGKDLYYLLNQGYKTKGASVFVGNHYLLSERQRLALTRGISSEKNIKIRKDKEININIENSIVNIDGFNTIITLEVALSNSLLVKCMDDTYRDLAGLRGTYGIIDKTKDAILNIGEVLEKNKIKKANFYLDSPVSNSGNLKKKIEELLKNFSFEVEVFNINNVDATLEKLENVISSDAIILDKCKSWINLNKEIIEKKMENNFYVDFNL